MPNKIIWQYCRGRFIPPTADLSASDCPTILSISIIGPLQYLFSLEKDTLMHEQNNGRHDDRESTPVGILPARPMQKQERSDSLVVSPAPRIEKAFPATTEKQIA